MATKKTETVTVESKSDKTKQANGSLALAPASVVHGLDAKDSVYDAVSKDLAAVGASDAQAKKIGSGPLGEARGNDVLRLHATLRATDLLNSKLNRVFASLQTAVADVDHHLHTDASALAGQAERQAASLLKALGAAQEELDAAVSDARSTLATAVQKAQTALGDQVTKAYTGLTKTTETAQGAISDQLAKAQTSLTKTTETAQGAVSDQLAKAQTSLSKSIEKALTDLQGRSDTLLETVQDSFSKLAQATAGTEENLKTQTNAFSTAVEELLTSVQNSLQKQVFEFREELTRQVDKRMNQSDVAFAAVRADQEVIKALLTDIIKDRMGRSEPKYR